jgi:hypothetical protein
MEISFCTSKPKSEIRFLLGQFYFMASATGAGVLFGDANNLPARLASQRSSPNRDIIYWSIPNEDAPLWRAMCCQSTFPMIFLPCFWPHLLIISPCLCCFASYRKSSALDTAAVLKSTSLELIRSNGTVTSIALENIASITVTTKNTPECCSPEINRLIIDDGRTVRTKHGHRPDPTIIWGHENMEEFRNRIMEAKERRSQMSTMAAAQAMIQMQMMSGAQQGMIYPGQGSPGQPPMGYSGQPAAVYPGQPPMGYPGQPPMGYPGQPPMGYPGQPPMGYPGQPAAVYPGQPVMGYSEQPVMAYPVQTPSNTVPLGSMMNSNAVEYPKRS